MADYTETNEQRVVRLQRVATSELRENIYKAISQSQKDAMAELINFDEVTNALSLKRLNASIKAIIEGNLYPAWEEVTEDYNQVAYNQAQFSANALMDAANVDLNIPLQDQVTRATNTAIMTLHSGSKLDSGVWTDFVKNNTDSMTRTYSSIITNAYRQQREGEAPTLRQISKQLRSANNGLIKNQADALARTGIVHFASQGQRVMANQNKSVISREYPIVTFDNRISDTCIAISANYGETGWSVGDSPIGYPPYHFSCRTIIGYMTKGQKKPEGTRTSVGGQTGKQAREDFEKREDRLRTASQVRYRGKRDTNVFKPESIAADTKINKWLLDQPTWFIEDTLGKKKGQLFIQGKLSLKNLTDPNLRPLTIDELTSE